jgi:hypothetical protein
MTKYEYNNFNNFPIGIYRQTTLSSHPHPTPPDPTLPTSHSGRGDDVSFFYGSIAVFGVFYSISLWEVALFLSER